MGIGTSIIVIDNDIPVTGILVENFPAGIASAFDKLMAQFGNGPGRNYYGISFPDNQYRIQYLATTENNLPGIFINENQADFMIRKGRYVSHKITGYRQEIYRIGEVFHQLLKDPELDPNGYCIEWYLNETDLICMVKLTD